MMSAKDNRGPQIYHLKVSGSTREQVTDSCDIKMKTVSIVLSPAEVV